MVMCDGYTGMVIIYLCTYVGLNTFAYSCNSAAFVCIQYACLHACQCVCMHTAVNHQRQSYKNAKITATTTTTTTVAKGNVCMSISLCTWLPLCMSVRIHVCMTVCMYATTTTIRIPIITTMTHFYYPDTAKHPDSTLQYKNFKPIEDQFCKLFCV